MVRAKWLVVLTVPVEAIGLQKPQTAIAAVEKPQLCATCIVPPKPLARLPGLEVEVGEGLALYPPRGWWHDVLSCDAETVGIIGRCVV